MNYERMERLFSVLPVLGIFLLIFLIGTFQGRKQRPNEIQKIIYNHLVLELTELGKLNIAYTCKEDEDEIFDEPNCLVRWDIQKNEVTMSYTSDIKLAKNYVNSNIFFASYEELEPLVIGLAGGVSAGVTFYQLNKLWPTKNKSYIGRIGKFIGFIAGIISGYELGIYVGRNAFLKCDSKSILEFLSQADNWKKIEKTYFWILADNAIKKKQEYYMNLIFNSRNPTSIDFNRLVREQYSLSFIHPWPLEAKLFERAGKVQNFDPDKNDFLIIKRLEYRDSKTNLDYTLNEYENNNKNQAMEQKKSMGLIENLWGTPDSSYVISLGDRDIIEKWIYKKKTSIFKNGELEK